MLLYSQSQRHDITRPNLNLRCSAIIIQFRVYLKVHVMSSCAQSTIQECLIHAIHLKPGPNFNAAQLYRDLTPLRYLARIHINLTFTFTGVTHTEMRSKYKSQSITVKTINKVSTVLDFENEIARIIWHAECPQKGTWSRSLICLLFHHGIWWRSQRTKNSCS